MGVVLISGCYVAENEISNNNTDLVKSNDSEIIGSNLSDDEKELNELCYEKPYEEVPSMEIPPCDAITTGYYYDGEKCLGKSLGCYGVFPFETLEDCQSICEI